MIKLIASDVDGTIVREGGSDVDPQLFHMIRDLSERDIAFVVASGRQYDSVRPLFEPVLDKIFFIADNGAYIYKNDIMLESETIPGDVWKEIVRFVHSLPDVEFMLSSNEGSYTDSNDPDFIRMVYDNYNIELRRMDDITVSDFHVSKIGVYSTVVSPVKLAEQASVLFGDKANILVSGDRWMDFVSNGADKGAALRKIMEHHHVLPEEIMVFGDNGNDVGMIRLASESYAVKNAKPETKKVAKYILDKGPDENAVSFVIGNLLEQIK